MGQPINCRNRQGESVLRRDLEGKKRNYKKGGGGGGKIFVKHNSEGYMSRIMYLVNVHVTVIDQ